MDTLITPALRRMKLRQVVLAEWQEGMQGQDGYYDVRLKCGHTIRCEISQLDSYMCCFECEARRQSLLLRNDPQEKEIMGWIEEVSDTE